MQLTLEQTMMIYQRAIDETAGAGEGAAWWAEVQVELDAVIVAPTTAAAAELIAWWHQDWRYVATCQRVQPAGFGGKPRPCSASRETT